MARQLAWPVMASLGLLTMASWLISIHPLTSLWSAMVALAIAGITAYRPHWGLTMLLALLPGASLSIWSGWRATDEFDVLLLLVLGGAYAGEAWVATRRPGQQGPLARQAPWWRDMPLSVRLAGLAVLLTWAVSAWRGWLDAGGVMPDMLWGDYESAGNVWRVSKSMVGLLLLAPWLVMLYRRSPARAVRSAHMGMLMGLILVCTLAVWERAVYVGVWDLSSDYRTTAWFWEMHVGGGAIDVYLALTAPYAWWAVWRARSVWHWSLAAALMMVVVYVIVTTYSRGVTGVFVGSSILLWYVWKRTPEAKTMVASWRGPAAKGLGIAIVLEAVCLLSGGRVMSDRFSHASVDAVGRWTHWQSLYGIVAKREDWWLGVGQGRLVAHQVVQASASALPGRIGAPTTADGATLRLHGPDAANANLAGRFALMRRVALPKAPQLVTLTLRADLATQVRFSVCERHLLYPIRCQVATGTVVPGGTRTYRWPLAGDAFDVEGLSEYREGMAMLDILQPDRTVEVVSWGIRSISERGTSQHADFSSGMDRWNFVSSGYFRPWHADNLYLELWVERGLLGSIAYIALMLAALWTAFQRWRLGHSWLLPIMGGLVSLMALGCVISVIELPRLAFLHGCMLLMASLWGGLLHDRNA